MNGFLGEQGRRSWGWEGRVRAVLRTIGPHHTNLLRAALRQPREKGIAIHAQQPRARVTQELLMGQVLQTTEAQGFLPFHPAWQHAWKGAPVY